MKVLVHGQGPQTLTQADYVAAGGEASIFCKGQTAFKIYTDRSRVIAAGKVSELSAIKDPDVVKPEAMVLDAKSGAPIGYTMRFVADTLPLCQIFTRAFREREGLDHAQMLALVQSLRERVAAIHSAHVVVVDLNEMNLLVTRDFKRVIAIDVDSYQTKSFPASAIMPSIRDWSAGQNFTELSDWFSFACLAFQMFVGIHPFKGQHPSLKGFEARMRAHASVFDPEVKTPAVVYPLSVIPSAYEQWLRAVLQDGKRLHPPSGPVASVSVPPTPSPSYLGTAIECALASGVLWGAGQPIVGFVQHRATSVMWTQAAVFINFAAAPILRLDAELSVRAVGFTDAGTAVLVLDRRGTLSLWDCRSRTPAALDVQAEDVMGYDGRVYFKSGTSVLELAVKDRGGEPSATLRVVARVHTLATRVFDGVMVHDLLGATYVSVFPAAGAHQEVSIRQLDAALGVKIVDARFDRGVLMVISHQDGQYQRDTFLIKGDEAVPLRSTRDITPAGLNFVVLDSGVVIQTDEEGELLVWAPARPDRTRRVVALNGHMWLVRQGGRAGAIRGASVLGLSLSSA